MKLGILFPVAIFIIAVVFLGWFLSAAMRRRVGHNEKSTIIMLVVAIVAVAGSQFGWW
jgi:Kef-type K+ transport system membrane component KefB